MGTYGTVVIAQPGEDLLDCGRVVADEVAVAGLHHVVCEDAGAKGVCLVPGRSRSWRRRCISRR